MSCQGKISLVLQFTSESEISQICMSEYIFRNFLKSKWGKEEFLMADAEAVGGRKNFIIIVLKDKLKMDELMPELRTYMRTYTYLKATKNTDKLVKRLRYE